MIRAEIRSKLKSIIQEKKLKQSEIAKQIGSTSNKLSSMLNCNRELKLDMYFNLCAVLNIEPYGFYKSLQVDEIINLCGKSVKEIAVTTSDGEVVCVVTAKQVIEHKGYKVVLVEN